MKAGARGFLLKDVSLEQLTAAIRDVAAGATIIRPTLTERVLRGLERVRRDFDALSPPDPLTRREIEVLRLMAGGYSKREIADALGTAEGTVKNHAVPPGTRRAAAVQHQWACSSPSPRSLIVCGALDRYPVRNANFVLVVAAVPIAVLAARSAAQKDTGWLASRGAGG